MNYIDFRETMFVELFLNNFLEKNTLIVFLT